MKKPNNILLNLCFCAFALIMLSACGGGGGAPDDGVPDGESVGGGDGATCLFQCTTVVGDETPAEPTCNDETHFCATPEKIEIATCQDATHNCETGIRTCDNAERFCNTPDKVSRGAACDARVYDCTGTGDRLACNDREKFCGTGETETLRELCEPRSHACGENNQGTGLALDCNDLDYFCGTTGDLRADCKPASHDCGEDNQGTGRALACNDITNFCGTGETGEPRADCEPRSHACGAGNQGTGIALDCNDITHFCGTGESEAERATCEPRSHACGADNQGTGARLACNDITHFCGTGETGAERATCNLRSHACGAGNQGTGFALRCNDLTHFCGTGETEEPRASCDIRTHNCGPRNPNNNNLFSGTGKLSDCNDYDRFCGEGESRTLRVNCEPRSHDCGPDATGLALDCNDITHFCDAAKAPRTDCDANIYNCTTGWYNPGTRDTVTGYLPPNTEQPPAGGWVAALRTARGGDYHASGGADRIGAAYAHARGYSGIIKGTSNSVTVSIVGESKIDRNHKDLSAQWVDGYVANSENSREYAGTCRGIGTHYTNCGAVPNNAFIREKRRQNTHLAGIIAGRSGNGGIQGIAYNAKIKPIDIFIDTDTATIRDAEAANEAARDAFIAALDTPEEEAALDAYRAAEDVLLEAYKPFHEKRAKAITQASGANIAVMVNNWHIERPGTVNGYYYRATRSFESGSHYPSGLNASQKTAWRKAAETTVLVFGAGDYSFNTETGMFKLYTDKTRSTRVADSSSAAYGNRPGSYGNLLNSIPELRGKFLQVIALDSNNTIYKYSNGCGATSQNWCLGAPGVDINSATISADPYTSHSTYEVQSGTAQASAHVAGAVAVLKGAFPHLTPTQLVSIILDSADYIPLKENDLGEDSNVVYGRGALNLARATEPLGEKYMVAPSGTALDAGITIDNSGITIPTSFGGALTDLTAGFTDDYDRAFIGFPERIAQQNIAFTLDETMATWDSPELQSIALDSNSKMQFTNYDESEDAKDTLIFTHHLPNHTIGFSYNEESKSPDLMLAGDSQELHFQKILPIAKDLMQVNSTYKLGKAWNVKNALTSGEFDTGNRFNEAMANLNYTGENHQLTIGAGTLKEYGQFLGASGTGAYQLSDATSSQVTHLAVTQNLPRNSSVKLKYTSFKTEVDMRYNNFAKINDLTANEYQLTLTKKQLFGKHDSLNFELIQPFAVTDGTLQQSTVLGYTADGDYNNVTQNFELAPTNRRQQLRMTWQNQLNNLKSKTKLFVSMQYDRHVGNLRDKEDSQILGGISTRF